MPFDTNTNRAYLRDVLVDPNTFATTMIVGLIDYYGTEFLNWSPETIRMETETDMSFKWPSTNFDRLMAGIALVVTDRFYKSTPDFIELCNILSGAGASPGQFDPADAAECAWGVTEALLLSPPDEDEPFTEEIRAYIGGVVDMEGIITPPDILRIGIVTDDRKYRIHGEYSNDPELYNAIWDTEASKTEEINSLVKERLYLLVNQLGSLQLQNGSTADIAKRMLSNLDSKESGGTPLV